MGVSRSNLKMPGRLRHTVGEQFHTAKIEARSDTVVDESSYVLSPIFLRLNGAHKIEAEL